MSYVGTCEKTKKFVLGHICMSQKKEYNTRGTSKLQCYVQHLLMVLTVCNCDTVDGVEQLMD